MDEAFPRADLEPRLERAGDHDQADGGDRERRKPCDRPRQDPVAHRLAGLHRNRQHQDDVEQPADPGRHADEVEPIGSHAEIRAREQRRAVAIEAARQERQGGRAERNLARPAAYAAPREQAQHDDHKRQTHPPQGGETAATQQIEERLTKHAPQWDIRRCRGLSNGHVHGSEEQYQAAQHRQASAARSG